MKGIVLAGGRGTRLYPTTFAMSKQLLPVYDKPLVYYPISMLMLAGLREILVISTPEDLPLYQRLLGDGTKWGISFSYAEQAEPRGLAEAFLIGRDFLAGGPVCLILGDNIFFGSGLPARLRACTRLEQGAYIFAHPVQDPQRYGIIEFDDQKRVLSIEEKPVRPRSHFAIPGIYFYDHRVVELAQELKPSARGELEITDLTRRYLEMGQLQVDVLGRGFTWLDAGTHHAMLQAAIFIQVMQERQGVMISCPEEIAYRMGYIDKDQLLELSTLLKNSYGDYLRQLLTDGL
jgi:glucose-1-phosphate thymidylyltransferase